MKEVDKEQIAEAAEQVSTLISIARIVVRTRLGTSHNGDIYNAALTGIIVGILSPRLLGGVTGSDTSHDDMRDVVIKLMDTGYPLDAPIGIDDICCAMVNGEALSEDEEDILSIIYLIRDWNNNVS